MDFGASPTAEAPAAEAAEAPALEALATEPDPPLEPPPSWARLAPAQPRLPARTPEAEPAAPAAGADHPVPDGWPIYLTALAISVLWALAPIAFALGYRAHVAPLQFEPFALVVFALLAIGPAAFVWGAAYMIRQGQMLAAESRRAKAMAEEMLSPALVAAARAGEVAQGVREEIARAGQAADEARETLQALREALALETQQLAETAEQSARTAGEMAGQLAQERREMGELSSVLDAQAARVADGIKDKARMVAEAAELADAQLREADTQLAARAADLAAAASEASGAARTAGEDLVRHIARLETAGAGVAEQVRAVEGGLSDQRAALAALAAALRDDQQAFAEQAQGHAGTLSEFIGQARLSAVEMTDRAARGGEALKQLMADAALQLRDVAELARAEREEFGHSTLQSLEAVAGAASEQRRQLEAQTADAIEALARAAEETREAAARHAAAAREQVDQLSEAAFTAGQKANQVFEARLEEARALIDQSSKMVEEAGAITASKLDEGAAAARASLAELAALVAEIESRAQQLPASARAQSEDVRAAVLQGMEDLMTAARRTAEEAQAIDLAFQERVRRNFEMLSEAVRLMGTAAAAAPAPRPLAAAPEPSEPPPAPAAPPRARTISGRLPRAAAASQPAAAAPPPVAPPEPELELDDIMEPAASAAAEAGAMAETLALRPRLKLTPTATDEEFSQVFEAAGGAPGAEAEAPDGEAWTWKDLLASIDGAEAEGERLQDLLGAEFARLGIEPETLLPAPRIDEIAAAVQTGDHDGARQVVKRLAPAAARRIARRLAGDDKLRRNAQTYIRRYQTLLQDAAVRDPEGFLTASTLAEPAGRLYLLLDAGAGEPG